MKCHLNIRYSVHYINIKITLPLFLFFFFLFPFSFFFILFPTASFFIFFSRPPFPPPPLAIVFCTIYTPAYLYMKQKFFWIWFLVSCSFVGRDVLFPCAKNLNIR